MTIECCSLAETEAFGRRLGTCLTPGTVITLDGPLGAGKTHLTRAIAEGLQVTDPRLVTSPTFVIVQEYPARLPIYHFDWYRLNHAHEVLDLGFDEYQADGGVCVIEWASKFPECLPAERLQIVIEPRSDTARRLTLTAHGRRHSLLFAAVETSGLTAG